MKIQVLDCLFFRIESHPFLLFKQKYPMFITQRERMQRGMIRQMRGETIQVLKFKAPMPWGRITRSLGWVPKTSLQFN